ncbi:phage tail-collar fiber domain-containing protein [Pseudomonas nitroreducens]|uniref:phage tail-collar fiber domain-containing protein n=1 Tax=Pseudomonas nitroreducens TaxID=46680 RepID=UPI002D810DC1|nr:phage tail protein [Pseudomonas nitroreducens]
MARITLAGENLIAQKMGAQQTLDITRFIFANVPGLDPTVEVDRAAAKPPANQIVYTAPIPDANKGYVNPSQVVYSIQVGSDVGDWDFNWVGLESAEGVLFAVSYVPLQQKRRNIPPIQVGNNVTRNFLVVFDGAQELTKITIDANTWQHDFTVRLAGIDERERLSNRDVYGRACFFGTGLQLEKVSGAYQLRAGIAYVEGVRLQSAAVLPVLPPNFPTTAWLDVVLRRELNTVQASWSVVWGTGKADYVDSAGAQHYCIPIAALPDSATVNDQRTVESINGPLVSHFAARVGDYAGLRARATTKDDVGLGNLPNAKSDDPATNSSEILATTKAVQKSRTEVLGVMVGQISAFARSTAPAGWFKANGAAVSRTAFPELFAAIGTTFGAGDGSTTFNLPDLRGEFLRGWDDGRGVDAGRAFATVQGGQNASHNHSATATANASASATNAGYHRHNVWTGGAGNHSHSYNLSKARDANPSGVHNRFGYANDGTYNYDGVYGSINGVGDHVHGADMDWNGDHSHAISVSVGVSVAVAAQGGNEARPRNAAVLFCIKY